MISLRSEELGPLTGAFFLEKNLPEIQLLLPNKKQTSKKIEGGVLFILAKFSFFEVSKGGQLGVNPSSHVFSYSITVFLPCGFFAELHRIAHNRTAPIDAP